MMIVFFWGGGLEAVNPGQVHSPLATLLVSFCLLHLYSVLSLELEGLCTIL